MPSKTGNSQKIFLLHTYNVLFQHKAEGDDRVKERQPWSMAHGFFAVSGGFVLDSSYAPEEYSLPHTRTSLKCKQLSEMLDTIMDPLDTPLLAENMRVNHSASDIVDFATNISSYAFLEPLKVTQQELEDKSEASGVAKTLVCIQASWFCLQCFARIGQRLPISLLELNTFGHSICALLVYCLWWDKPLDIGEPISLHVQDRRALRLWDYLHHGVTLHSLAKNSSISALEILKRRRGPLGRRRRTEMLLRVCFDLSKQPEEDMSVLNVPRL